MTKAQELARTMGVPKQDKAKEGQTKLIVRLDNGMELFTFCATENVNDTAKMIKESLKDVVAVIMVSNE